MIIDHKKTDTHEEWVIATTKMAYLAAAEAGLPTSAMLYTEVAVGAGQRHLTFRVSI